LVTYGYNHGEPIREVDADAYVDSLAEIGGVLQALGLRRT
jgi:phosphoglycolate phosphatase